MNESQLPLVSYSLFTNVEAFASEFRKMPFTEYEESDLVVLTYAHRGTKLDDPDFFELEYFSDQIFTRFNRDDRPTADYCPALSVGDIILFSTLQGQMGMAIENLGFRQVPEPQNLASRDWKIIVREAQRD